MPLGRYGNEPIRHDTIEDVVFVVCDTLIDETSRIEKVALKDIEIMQGETIPLDKVKQIREEIQKLVDMCGSDTVADLSMKSGLGLALEKIDKLIEK